MPSLQELAKDYTNDLKKELGKMEKELDILKKKKGHDWSEKTIEEQINSELDVLMNELDPEDVAHEIGESYCRYKAGSALQQWEDDESA